MKESSGTKPSLNNEFHNLGKNLVSAIKAAWENPERKKLQDEIESGISEFGSTIKEEIEKIQESPTGQQIKTDLDDLQERIKKGEIETKIREDLLSALEMINAELLRITQKWKTTQVNQEQTNNSNIHIKDQSNDTSNTD